MNLGAMPERNRTIIRLYEVEGYTSNKLGSLFGISGQRVRWILKRAGVALRARADYRKRVRWTCMVCGMQNTLQPCIARSRKTCSTSCRSRLLTIWDRPKLIEELQQLAAELGHTPGLKEINHVSPPDHMTYVRKFGSICAAQVAAGLVPNATGAPGHIARRQKATP